MANAKLTTAVEAYFKTMHDIRATGGATDERSYYPALTNLLNAIGGTLKPKVLCVSEMANQGAGHPDYGLYSATQLQKKKPQQGQLPERGVIEVKPVEDDAWDTAAGTQVSKYWNKYRLVLVTNYRDLVLQGEDAAGKAVNLESFRLADSAEDFWKKVEHPRSFARAKGTVLGEYLIRVLSYRATIVEPRDLAWLLASYARDGLARVEAAGDIPSLASLRNALEEALGIQFNTELGVGFFRSTLVQTLFYGVFSAWVLWARQTPPPTGPFDWRTAAWHLRVPVIQALFQQVSSPSQLHALDLVELLDWTAAALDRVDRDAFFAKFNAGEAVPYFYEPFLEAFDPDLRKQLGVWYTPPEVVQYMVARVDRALKDDLGITDGLAAENVYVLDPCCGTGTYLAATLKRISANLYAKGAGALTGAQVKQAAMNRVFGFEIMPAPFVVAHLQVGLTMQELDAPLLQDGTERAGVYLTNALTGWERLGEERKKIPFPGLEEERDQAEKVKQDTPILVVLGNPPYNGFAGVAIKEEREQLEAYRNPKKVQIGDSRALNDLYIRFFRMAERRIAEKTGKGVVCFISNYSWLDGLSFAGMRERYLETFDAIRIDNLHGDRIISEYAPDGRTSETVFALRGQSPGITVGTAITMLSKTEAATTKPEDRRIWYRDFHQARADERRQALLDSIDDPTLATGYTEVQPQLGLGYPFKPISVDAGWQDWPALPKLFEKSFPGVHSGRDRFLVDIDLDHLKARVADYFNPVLSNEDIARRYPAAMRDSSAFKVSDARRVRDALLARGGPNRNGFVQDSYRPFDNRWLYWEADRRLLTAPSPDYWPHVFEGNVWLSSARHLRKETFEPQACVARHFGSFHLIERGAAMFPAWLGDKGLGLGSHNGRRANLSPASQSYLKRLGLGVEDLFHHVLAVLHDPTYLEANAGALRMDWPRIPLPGWPDGETPGAAAELVASATRGRELASLLDSDTPVSGVTEGALRPEITVIAVPSTVDETNMAGEDFAVKAGWGHFGQGDTVMPGQGRVDERSYTAEEKAAFGPAPAILGATTFDVYLNGKAYWRNVPSAVWQYKLGGYQVLKKWLSYREHKVLGRPLKPDEVQHFTDTARRIAAILQLVND